jgi:plastocyanin
MPVLSRSEVREIRLVARDMAFYLEEDPDTANPTITVTAGESVRIVLKNADQGLQHDFAVPATKASTKLLRFGNQDAVVVKVPTTPGTYEYVCLPHRPMMRGEIRVVTDP